MKLGTLTPTFRLGSATPSRIYLGANLVWESMDSDAADYFARGEANGSTMTAANKAAVNALIVGIKMDAAVATLASHPIKAACLLAGWDSLAGALTPLVGDAPTNFNFEEGNYSRTTGLLGNGAKYLDSNRSNASDPQDSHHMAIFATDDGNTTHGRYIGTTGSELILKDGGTAGPRARNRSSGIVTHPNAVEGVGLLGVSRASAANYDFWAWTYSVLVSNTSQTPTTGNVRVLANGNSRQSFYSIGESLDLALLDARLTALMSSLT